MRSFSKMFAVIAGLSLLASVAHAAPSPSERYVAQTREALTKVSNLTADQQTKAETSITAAVGKIDAAIAEQKSDGKAAKDRSLEERREHSRKIQTIVRDAQKEIDAVLNKEQKAEFKKAIAELRKAAAEKSKAAREARENKAKAAE